MKLWKIYTPVAITKVKTVHANNASESENGAGLSPGSAPLVALSMLICPLVYKNGHLTESGAPASDKKLTLGSGLGFALQPR